MSVLADNGSYRVVPGLAEARVPDTVQGIIMARLTGWERKANAWYNWRQ
jgi:hypothetical protein